MTSFENLYLDICAFLFREGRLLDDRQFDEWVECYDPEAVFWMPCWDDADSLVDDPTKHISLIYYPNRIGLEDRVFRLNTERSGASSPEPRTTHNISNVEIVERAEKTVKVRFNWHTMNYRYKTLDHFFGTSYYTLKLGMSGFSIVDKKVVLKNDLIHQVIDVYHV
ncbi:benzoate 1,2-dioxygenase small subunit [Caballeronia novacaledonica]|uniref:Benzoate 1,2-dioxygenase small subunit n=1 Tax=Caballeronia novacaledonica TaxID=1544861 RepID=A0AA37IBU9_9BURK|nr:benzoate 1,2-dioxygenase small subunit [Caballeronia novacaledonica]GJH27010.1 benzoate 1,2-dioxygenase small subunit [Caballeronia novacaledonica]